MTDKFTFNTPDELGKKIREVAESEFENLTQALIHMVENYLNTEKRYAPKENACPLQYYLGESEAPEGKNAGKGWYCMKKAPALTKLGSGIIEAADKICEACQIRDEALADSKTLKEQRTKGIIFMLHSCTKGAKINEDMTQMLCPEVQRWRPIMTRKKKTDYVPCRERGTNKARCINLVSTQTVIKGKLPTDGQNL